MTKLNYQTATFLLSVANLEQLPNDHGVEVAIVGRSNAGKSSVLNQLTQNRSLARVSKTPGRTQHINVFTLDATRRLIDLPGYGYAKVSHNTKTAWQDLLDAYLGTRGCLAGLLLVMDIRHPLKPIDLQILAWCNTSQLSVHILLNKADKLSTSAAKKTLMEVSAAIKPFQNNMTLQLFSALKGTGAKELREVLDAWYG